MGLDVSAIFDAVPTAHVLLDRELRFVWANKAYLAVTGRSLESLIGQRIDEAFPAEGKAGEMLHASFERVFETGRADHLPLIPYPIAAEGGRIEQRYWSATHTPILDDAGEVEYLLQNTQDVTELYLKAHRAEASGVPDRSLGDEGGLLLRAETVAQQNLELGQATQFFETVFDQAPSFIAILSEPNHIFRLANKAYMQIVGTHRRIIGRSVSEALPEVVEQGFIGLLDKVYESGEAMALHGVTAYIENDEGQCVEHIIDFVYQPLSGPNGRTIGILVQGHDVTAQVRAEREQHAASERFRTMAQNMPAHVWTARSDGTLDWVSDRVYDYTGTRDDQILGANWAEVVHPEDMPRVAPIWSRAIASGTTYETEFRIRDAAGGYRWFLVRAAPVRGPDGAVAQWIGTNTDIEGRRVTEAALAELNATLEHRVEQRNRALEEVHATLRQSQKMEAIGNLAGGVAHDFNNLLQAITGSLQLASRELPADSVAARRIGQAMGAVHRGATLAAQLLAFGRRQPLEPRAVDLGRMLDEIGPILRSAVGEGVRVETAVAPNLWNTLVDATNLESALLNLAVNARDAMEGQGRLLIELENARIDPEMARAMTDVVPGEYLRLSVTDDGIGMSADVIEKIFEPFFTTKPEGKGTGLGMAMVYGFVKQSGGHVTIDSAPGEGTVVRIFLPRSLRPEQRAPQRSGGPVIGGSETVLLVEDDADVRRIAAEMLIDLGYTVIEAEDADAGLARIEAGMPFDLLLTDVVMPGRATAREMSERAKALRPGLPVLFASGYTRDAIVHDGRLDEGIQLLPKPYRRETLARRLREMLDHAPAPTAPAAPAVAPPPADPAPVAAPAGGEVAGLRIVVCEDDTFIRLDLVEMLAAAGAEVREAATGAQALDLLAASPADRLLIDVGLPDRSGLEVARDAVARQPGLSVIFATGRDKVPGAEDLPQSRILTKPFGQEALLRAVAGGLPLPAGAS